MKSKLRTLKTRILLVKPLVVCPLTGFDSNLDVFKASMHDSFSSADIMRTVPIVTGLIADVLLILFLISEKILENLPFGHK